MTSEGTTKPVILVVEDEPVLRVVAVDMVRDAGLEAIGVVDAAAALHVLRWRHDICVVFTDIEMPPGINGLELATVIRDSWPTVRTILTSGCRQPCEAELAERDIFFAKPYEPREVVAAMKRFAAEGLAA